MSWATPTLEDLVTAQIRAFSANLEGADASLLVNNLRPVAKIIAGGLYELHQAMAKASDQKFVLTCEAGYLDRHGAEMKPPLPRKSASRAGGVVALTSAGPATLATGAVLARSDGVQFTVEAGIVLPAAGTAEIRVTAVLPGSAGNTAASAVLSASSGLTGSASLVVTAGGLGGGADAEQDEAYRARLLFSKAYPEHGGAAADWLRYALTVPGVTAAWIDPLAAGRGTVVIYPVFGLTRPSGIPTETERLLVKAALDIARPGAGLPVVRAATAVPVNVTISGLMPATPEVRNAVAVELAYAFARLGRVAGLSAAHPSMPFLATPASFSRSWIWQAVANATGEERHAVEAPTSDITLTAGQIATLGAVSFA